MTVITLVTVQPAPGEKEITATPVVTPVTMPEDEPTVAIDVLLLFHVPVPTDTV